MLHLGALLCSLLAAFAPAPRVQDEVSRARTFEDGVAAYRDGDYETAANLWMQLWSEGADGVDLAALCYDLGNVTYRLDRPLEAAGWYAAAVRLAPRNADLWANLELARERARLDPADRGDLLATGRRLLEALTLAEAEWLVLLMALALALALVLDAVVGGSAARRAVWVVATLLALSLLPWGWRLATEGEDPHFVIAAGGLPVRSEPRASSAEIGRLEAGETVEAGDGIPGWLRVRSDAGLDGWVAEASLLRLTPPGASD